MSSLPEYKTQPIFLLLEFVASSDRNEVGLLIEIKFKSEYLNRDTPLTVDLAENRMLIHKLVFLLKNLHLLGSPFSFVSAR